MMFDACIEELLVRGLDDWIQAAAVSSIAKVTGGAQSADARRALSLRLIRKLLDDGLAEVGMVYKVEGFRAWGVSVESAMDRIESDWSSRPDGPGLGEVCWLRLTEQGHARGEGIWRRRAKKHS